MIKMKNTKLHTKQQGKTLIELLVVLVIVFTLFSLASPNWLAKEQHQKLAVAHSIASLFQQGANMAMATGNEIVLCPSANGRTCIAQWNANAWIFFINTNNNTRFDKNELLIRSIHIPSSIAISFQAASQPRFLRWYPTGHINRAFSLGICAINNQHASSNLALIVNLQSRIRRGQDSNNDGNEETASGKEVHC